MNRNIKEIISKMTLEEKASMCSGKDVWNLESYEHLGIPRIMVADGPHGLRKQAAKTDIAGLNESIKAVCFPSAAGLACTFNKDLIYKMGENLGEVCQSEDIAVLLGPGINIKRSPLCGRNFEYFSEDPYLTGELAASYINGVQSKNIGTSLKHFAVNNQEYRRMYINSVVDERTLREIYLSAFEIAVKKVKPWTVMCSYNRINGEFASENKRLLTDILRDEWGFDGFVVSDWGATKDRVKGIIAGMDLEMPSSKGYNDKKIVEAVKAAELDEKLLDKTVDRILNIIYRYHDNKQNISYDLEKGHLLAEEIAGESMVLLKNDEILPISKNVKLTLIGKFAEEPRYQGGGSSHINSYKVVGAKEILEDNKNVTYAKGFDILEDKIIPELVDEAVAKAKESEIAIVFAGLPDYIESEGYDRTHLNLPNCQNYLIEEISKVQSNIVVVLHNGSPILMPWLDKVGAVLNVNLGGEAVGEATVKALYGDINPSGKLAETYPKRLSDTPCYLNFPGNKEDVKYSEGVFVGYRYYDIKEMDVLFSFGHGLSYTKFEYSDLCLSSKSMNDSEILELSLKVKNTGDRAGKEIIQLYVKNALCNEKRPIKELKGFEKIEIMPEEEKIVNFKLDKRAFAYYDINLRDWKVETGVYGILIGKSSRDIVLEDAIEINSTKNHKKINMDTLVEDIFNYPEAIQEIFRESLEKSLFYEEKEKVKKNDAKTLTNYSLFLNMPLGKTTSIGFGGVSPEEMKELINKANELL